jgi:sporulation protein YlmC with PRC-barrel domain
MDIPVDADVQCVDGPCGQSTDIVINPTVKQVTHLVVKEEHVPHAERLVSLDWVTETTPTLIRLRCTSDELAGMDKFIEREYVMAWPYALSHMSEPMAITLEHKHVPQGEMTIHRGARVHATDGHVGQVDEFLIDPTDEHITHLVLREGHLWGQKDVTIPVSQIDRIEENTVYLKLDKRHIEALPAVPVRRKRA